MEGMEGIFLFFKIQLIYLNDYYSIIIIIVIIIITNAMELPHLVYLIGFTKINSKIVNNCLHQILLTYIVQIIE